MNNKSCVSIKFKRLLVVGIPAGGKSSLIELVKEKFRQNGIEYVVKDDFEVINRICPESSDGEKYYHEEGNLIIRDSYRDEILEIMYILLAKEIENEKKFVFWELTHPKLFEILPKYFERFISRESLLVWVGCDYKVAFVRNGLRVGHVIPDSYMKLFEARTEENLVWLRGKFEKMIEINNNGDRQFIESGAMGVFKTLSE